MVSKDNSDIVVFKGRDNQNGEFHKQSMLPLWYQIRKKLRNSHVSSTSQQSSEKIETTSCFCIQ